jgi:hypothetical protein
MESMMSNLSLQTSSSTSTASTPIVVVVHNQSNTASSTANAFVQRLFADLPSISKRPLQLYDIGHKLRPIIPTEFNTMYYPLPIFPTSDEVHEMIVHNISSKSKLHKRFDIGVRGASAKNLTLPTTTLDGMDKRILRILLAEDNIINQKVMLRLLSRFPCTVEIANNGIEAIERAQNEEWDLMYVSFVLIGLV